MCKKTVISRACKIALGAAVEEADEPDTAAMQRQAAQQPQEATELYQNIEEAAQVVDVETGEVLEPVQEACGEAANEPLNLFNAQENKPAETETRKCPL